MAFGNELSLYGIVAFSFFSIISYLFSGEKRIDEKNFKIFKIILVSNIILAVVYFFQDSFIEEKGVLLSIISSFMAMLIFNDEERKKVFFNLYINFILLLCLSSIITYIISYPNDYYRYILRVFNFKRNQYSFVIFFPFSVIYRLFQTNIISLPRFTHFFVEPGIAPCFITSVIVLVLKTKKSFFKYFKIFILSIGLLITFSTSIFPVLGLGIFFYYISNNFIFNVKTFILIILIITVAFQLFLKIPYFGFLDKSLTHGSSFNDRIIYWNKGLENFSFIVTSFINVFIVFKILYLKNNKIFFLAVFLPIFFTGFINVVWLTTSYIVFLYYDSYNITEIKNNADYK
jgi:hypothetical protein